MKGHSIRGRIRASLATFVRAGTIAGAMALATATLGAQARTGAGAAKAAPPVLDSLAAAPAQRQSWTSDKQRLGIGDIVTILIDERTLASANLTDNNSETKQLPSP